MTIGIAAEDMADVVLSTLNKFHKDQWVGEMTDIQEHVGFNDMCKKKRERLDGSRGDRVRVITDHNYAAEATGLFGTVDFKRDDAAEEGTVPWRYIQAPMVFDTREPDMNSGPERMFDHIKVEDARTITSLVEKGEEYCWGKPDNSSDATTPWGLEYWVVPNATTGFNGGNPSGFTSGRAGISSSTYARHKNFTGAYTDYTDQAATGLITLMEEAATKMTWVSAAPEPGMGRKGYTKSIYLDYDRRWALKNVSKTNNDSLGFDLSTPEPVFRGAPLKWAPYLENKSTHPVYMIDNNTFYAVFLKDWYMKRIQVEKLPNQPTCFGIVLYMTFNFVCHDLRKQAVFYSNI